MTGATTVTLARLNAAAPEVVAATLAPVFEHASWVTGGLAATRPFASLTALHGAMLEMLAGASRETVLAFLRGHPALSPAALRAGTTAESEAEQRSAGLHVLDDGAAALLDAANAAYLARFGYPFILAVRGLSLPTILAALERRSAASPEAEWAETLHEIAAISWMRLLDRIAPAATGGVSLHVLDTARARPAAGLHGELWTHRTGVPAKLAAFTTDGNGEAPTMLDDGRLAAGAYEWRLDTAAYFARHGRSTIDRAFLPLVCVRFAVWNAEEHFHVPVLLTPGAYTAYRGS